MRTVRHWMAVFLVFALSVCPAGAAEPADSAGPPTPIAAADVRPHVEYLASPELRGRNNAEARIAGQYIADHFQSLKIEPLFEGDYFQPIPGAVGENQETRIVGRNVAGWIPGGDPELRDEFVIISAHYDHLGVRNGEIHPGADDNASGVSMLLETARQIAARETPLKRSVVFIGFDLEEHLLWGSRWFAAHTPWPMEQVKLFITADMIGRSLGDLPLPSVFVLGSEYATGLSATLDEVGAPENLEIARLGVDLIGTRSDYGPFRDAKVPFLFFSTGEHPDYHTPRDTPDRVDFEKVAGVSNIVLAVASRVADAEATPVWTDQPEPGLDEVRTVNRITTLLLEQDGQDGQSLGETQRFFVSQVKSQTAGILARGTMTGTERSILVRAAQLLLLSVF